MEYTFLSIPKTILSRVDLNPTDKIIFGLLLGFQSNGDSWASNEYISKQCGISVRSVARSLDFLEEKGLIERKTEYVGYGSKRRYIKACTDIYKCQNGTSECQNDTSECQNGTQVVPKWHSYECQNGTILDNNYNIKDKIKNTHSLSSLPKLDLIELDEQETEVVGKLKVKDYPLLYLTINEAVKIEEMLKQLKFNNKKQIDLIFIQASDIAGSSSNPKRFNKSFSFIKIALDEFLKTRKLRLDLEYSENKTTSKNVSKNLKERQIFKKS